MERGATQCAKCGEDMVVITTQQVGQLLTCSNSDCTNSLDHRLEAIREYGRKAKQKIDAYRSEKKVLK